MRRLAQRNLVPIIVVFLLAVWGAAVGIPHTFKSGDVVSAGTINDNFDTLAGALTGVEDFTGRLAGNFCAAGEAVGGIAPDGTPTCVAVSGGAGLTSVTHDLSLSGEGTVGSALAVAALGVQSSMLADGSVTSSKVAAPLSLSTTGSNVFSVIGTGGGVSNAALRSTNTAGGIAAWLTISGVSSSDTVLGLSQSGNGPLIKGFGSNGGNEEFRIGTDGTFLLFKPTATNTNDFNIKLDNGNGHVVAVAFDTLSDVHAKDGFAAVDAYGVLAALDAMPVRSWAFKDDTGAARHIGPTAQDFHSAFGYGADPTRIATVDADGVAFAAIQALSRENRELRQSIADLDTRLAAFERALAALSDAP